MGAAETEAGLRRGLGTRLAGTGIAVEVEARGAPPEVEVELALRFCDGCAERSLRLTLALPPDW
jgi:hypothetical protein